jgi:hypothetical protein
MIAKLPLDSPFWHDLTACYSLPNALAQLRTIVTTRQLGDPWQSLRGEILHQGSVYGVSSAVIPHLVDLVPDLPVDSRRDLWVEIGFLVTAGADEFPPLPEPGLQEGLTASLRVAETLAVRDFLADPDADLREIVYYALACVALAGHRIGRAMWAFPSPTAGYVGVTCPACETEYEVDGFGDPVAPPCRPPDVRPAPAVESVWRDVAAAIDKSHRDKVLGPGWEGFLDVARRIAASGVPVRASPSAVWCLVAAMVVCGSPKAASWARTLTRLAGHVHCPDCDTVWAIADVMGDSGTDDARPVSVVDGTTRQGVLFVVDGQVDEWQPPAGALATTIANGDTGFRPAPGRRLSGTYVQARVLWRAEIGAVNALSEVAGGPSIVAAGSSEAVSLWDIDSGLQIGPALDGPAATVASVASPDGRSVIAAGDDSVLRWWDVATGQLLDGDSTAGPARIQSLALVRMPPDPDARTVAWLAKLRDGRTMLAAGDADGTVMLWDPATRTPVGHAYRRPGRAVLAMTALHAVDESRWNGTQLIVAHDDRTVDVWSSAGVTGERSPMTPGTRKLVTVGHQQLVGLAVSPQRHGQDLPLVLADRNGTVSMWTTYGIRLGDPLPSDSGHRDVVGVAAVAGGLGGGIIVATLSRVDQNLRLWEPSTDTLTFMSLTVQPRCLLHANGVLVIGHDTGLLTVAATDGHSGH